MRCNGVHCLIQLQHVGPIQYRCTQHVFQNNRMHTCQPREKFWRDKRGATERSEATSEGGPGGTPPENFKNLHCKWCNLCYS